MRLGVHVSIAGGLGDTLSRAKWLACTTIQIFSRSPRGGPAPKHTPEDLNRFDAERRAAGIDPLAIHSPYIINLASPEPGMWEQSLRLYQEEYARAGRFCAQYLVTHVGSHRGRGEAEGIAHVAQALTRTLEGLDSDVMILLENTAGSGQGIGDRFEHLAAIRRGVGPRNRVGVCLDTAHLFAAGHPIHTRDGLARVLEAFDRIVGLGRLKLIHLNDSKVPFDSRVDRHWHIGQGHIGAEAFGRIVTHPALRDLPFILETPKSTEQDDHRNLAVVRKLAGSAARGTRRRRAVTV